MRAAEREVTFLIADLAGFTALTEAHGARGAASLVARYVALAQAALAPGARLVERAGDEVLIAADDPGAAVRTALALAAALAAEPDFPLARMGLDAGPVVEEDGRFFGPALNRAARVAAHARAGQILGTAPIAAAAVAAGVTLHPLGPVAFRNVAEPVEVFELRPPGAPLAGRPRDPVCRMQVDPATAAGRLRLGGTDWYFCSLECARAFAGRPDRYREGA